MIAKQPSRISGFSLTDKCPLCSFSEAAQWQWATWDINRRSGKGNSVHPCKISEKCKSAFSDRLLNKRRKNPLENFQRSGKLGHEHTAGGLFGFGCTIHHQTRGTKTSSSVKRITGWESTARRVSHELCWAAAVTTGTESLRSLVGFRISERIYILNVLLP